MTSLSSVCIVGVGARTPLGLDAASSAAAVRGSISIIADHPYMIDKAGEPMRVAIDSQLSPDTTPLERFQALADSAIGEALSPLISSGFTSVRPFTIVGLPEQRPGLPERFAEHFAAHLTTPSSPRLPLGRVATLSSGHASGLMALEEAFRQIQSGAENFCLAGAVDSYINPDTLQWLDQERQLMSAENRSGFPPGEGAAFCLLTSSRTARSRQLDIMAEVVSIATAREENRIKTDTICTGLGLSRVIAQVSAALRLPEEKIDFTYCDLNGERYRSEEFAFTALRTQNAFVEVTDNLTPADCWGDMGAASGPLFATLAIASGQRGYAKGPTCLLWAGSEGGLRAAAIIRLPLSSV